MYKPSTSSTTHFIKCLGLLPKTLYFRQWWKRKHFFSEKKNKTKRCPFSRCHEIWSFPLNDSNPFDTSLGSWFYQPTGFGWQFSQERTRCSWNMSDNINWNHNALDSLGAFSRKNHPRIINHSCILFHWENISIILYCQNATKPNKRIQQVTKWLTTTEIHGHTCFARL